jgi:hypothetical protein
MHRQGYDLQLTQYDERGWRATFYTTQPFEARSRPKEPVKQAAPDERDWHAAGGVREGGSLTTWPTIA